MPFGYGEVEPIDRRFSVSVARFYFLEQIRQDAPEVLTDLGDLPFRMFCEANVNPARLWPITNYDVILHGNQGGLLLGFRLTLLRWARRWNLETDWLLDNACWVLDMWRRQPRSSENRYWLMGGVGWMRLNEDMFAHLTPPLEIGAWHADNQFRSNYLKFAKEQIEQHIEQNPHLLHLPRKLKREIAEANMVRVNAYCEEVLKVYLSLVDASGKPTWKLADSKREIARNISWTVKFQVLGKTFSGIAKENKVSPSTVKREVENTLALIKLPKRTDAKPGRRPGSKESPDSWRRATKRANIIK